MNKIEKFDQAIRVGDQIELRSKGNEAFIKTERVFGGISPASGESPFYACCFCQLPHRTKSGKKKLLFLEEAENKLPELFFDQLVKLSRRYFSWDWYFNTSDADDHAIESMFSLFKNYTQLHDISQIRLLRALTLDWNTGILTIQQWYADGALETHPGTILAFQLGKMESPDRQTSRRKFFYAPDALRALMGIAAQNRYRSNYPSQEGYFYF